MPVLLTVAGFDPSNGAGVTADLQTFAAHGFFGTSAITALTVQSTQGVQAVEPIPAELLRDTLSCLHGDLPPLGVKIGMLATGAVVENVVAFLSKLHEVNWHKPNIPIVLDPVTRSSSGRELLAPEALDQLHRRLLPLVGWITPNWTELSVLADAKVTSEHEARQALDLLALRHPRLTIVATGGDQRSPTDLLRLPSGEIQSFAGEHLETRATHGTGCAFSSALLCRLVQGNDPQTAVAQAKDYVAEAMRRAPGLGKGHGPLNLLWPLTAS